MLDLDAELKFKIGDDKQSWDIQKSQTEQLFALYKSLYNVYLMQITYETKLENVKSSMGIAAKTTNVPMNANSIDQFKAIVEYGEERINDMLIYDFSSAFE